MCVGYGAVVDAVGGSGAGGVSSGRWLEVAGKTGENEDEEDEAVFAAVIGEGELFNTVECVSVTYTYPICLSPRALGGRAGSGHTCIFRAPRQ